MNSQEADWDRFRLSVMRSKAARMLASAPVGAGLGEIVLQLVQRQAEKEGLSVIVAPSLALVDQWTHRLRTANISATSLNGNSELLLLLDRHHGTLPDTRVLIVTSQLLALRGQGPGLADIRPALLILDNLKVSSESRLGHAVRSIADRAAQVVVVDHHPSHDLLIPVDEMHYFSMQQMLALKQTAIKLTLIEVDDPATGLRREARNLLGATPLLAPDASLAELHSYISRQLAMSSTKPQEGPADLDSTASQRLDQLLAKIEDQEDDPRAQGARDFILRAREYGRPCLVTMNKVVDAEYLASRVRSEGLRPGLLTGAMNAAHRVEALEQFQEGGILISTRAILAVITAMPPRTAYLLWSSPNREALWRDLALVASSSDAELATFDPQTAVVIQSLLRNDAERSGDAQAP